MGFAAIARVTENRWVACAVRDSIAFGLEPGQELKLETTICNDIRASHKPVAIDHVETDIVYKDHHTPALYGFQSYISVPIFRKDGQFFGTLCSIDPKPNLLNNPETIGMFNLYADLISYHLHTLEARHISQSNLAFEEKNDAVRDQFIAILGHDLRNPLSAISMSSELLKESHLGDDDLQLVTIISRSARRMSDLITSILDFAKARMGNGIALNRTSKEPLQEILQHIVKEFEVSQSHAVIKTEFDLSDAIYCDSNRLAELFSNLLGNAIAYGRTGHPIYVKAFCRDNQFHLSVTNTGEKIPDPIKERLFQPFVRGNIKDGKQGLGLGLFIASEIARAHKGTIEVHSSDQETNFTLIIPVEEKGIDQNALLVLAEQNN